MEELCRAFSLPSYSEAPASLLVMLPLCSTAVTEVKTAKGKEACLISPLDQNQVWFSLLNGAQMAFFLLATSFLRLLMPAYSELLLQD